MITLKRPSLSFLTVLFLTVTVLQSCKVQFVPEYDASVAQQIESTAKMVDRFYLIMAETTTEQKGREYEKFAEGYVDIQVELMSLLNKNKMRPLNKSSIENCELALGTWKELKEFHKESNTLSDVMIENFQLQMHEAFIILLTTENANKMAETN